MDQGFVETEPHLAFASSSGHARIGSNIRDYKRGFWGANWADACSSFSGCPYLMLCESQEPESWLKVNFKDRTWNPLESRD